MMMLPLKHLTFGRGPTIAFICFSSISIRYLICSTLWLWTLNILKKSRQMLLDTVAYSISLDCCTMEVIIGSGMHRLYHVADNTTFGRSLDIKL
jgi:hypothetical protein